MVVQSPAMMHCVSKEMLLANAMVAKSQDTAQQRVAFFGAVAVGDSHWISSNSLRFASKTWSLLFECMALCNNDEKSRSRARAHGLNSVLPEQMK